jgi:hypothetical protein
MAFHEGKVRYTTALGMTNTPGGWREGMAEGGIVMEVPSGRIAARSVDAAFAARSGRPCLRAGRRPRSAPEG